VAYLLAQRQADRLRGLSLKRARAEHLLGKGWRGDKTLVARNGGVPFYSPDGQKIAYVGPDGEIYTINARGGGKSRVTNNVLPYGLSWGIRP
jgi:hypothetical protein